MSDSLLSSNASASTRVFAEVDRRYLTDFIRGKAAIETGEGSDALFLTRLESIMSRFDIVDTAALVRRIRMGDLELETAVIDEMTTNETYWFRDAEVFDDLESRILPTILRNKPEGEMLTIWSAASSSGQEIYSLAMLLDQRFHTLTGKVPRVRLLATDLSTAMVERVRDATYTEIEIQRGLPVNLRDRYFTRKGSDWVAKENIRRLVFARPLNLNEPLSVVPRCDLVLLRNVLSYFSKEVKSSILEQIRTRVLRPHGALLLGASELLLHTDAAFSPIRLPNGLCYVPDPTPGSGQNS